MTLATAMIILTPIDIAFSPKYSHHWGMLILDAFVEIIFVIDILLAFRTTYIDVNSGQEVYTPRKIACHYLQGMFVIDILAAVPVKIVSVII
jgi:hypothetical protein